MGLDDIKIDLLHWQRGYHIEEKEEEEIFCDITGEVVGDEYIVFQDEKVIKYEKDLLELLKSISPFDSMDNDESILSDSWELEYWYYEEK